MAKNSLPQFPKLQQNIRTRVLIIGGGMAGLLCSHQLQQAGVDHVLLEAREIAGGTTGCTTAKITVQHGLIYHKIGDSYGMEAARQYYEAQSEALEHYRRLAARWDCDFQFQDSYVYALDSDKKLKKECKALQALGVEASLVQKLPIPVAAAGAVKIPGQAQFDPLKFLSGLVKDLPIYEHSPVQSFDGKKYRTPEGSVQAEKTVVATHFPIFNKHGLYPLKMYQSRSYVLALENAPDFSGMYVDEGDKGLSFRRQGQWLLLGGGGHRTGKKGGNWAELEEFARRHYPNATVRYRWATQDCMSLDGMPYIGSYARSRPDLFVATGFSKWGMTNAMAAALVLSDLVQGRENPYEALFSPSRSSFHPQLGINAVESAVNLLTPTVPRCPHLGCALKWNKAEHSWDCPCHGSRFAENGHLLDGPATGDLH